MRLVVYYQQGTVYGGHGQVSPMGAGTEEWISISLTHRLLPTPFIAHVETVSKPDGQKISKGDVDLVQVKSQNEIF